VISALCVLAAAVLATPPAAAPAPAAPPPDPALLLLGETRGFTAGRPTAPALTPDGSAVLFLRSGPRDRVQALYETSVATGQTRLLASPAKLSAGAAPDAAEAARLERQRIGGVGITAFELSGDGARVLFAAGGRVFLLERATGGIRELRAAQGATDPRLSPDGREVAFVLDRDLYAVPAAGGPVRRLTSAHAGHVSNGLAEFVAQEEMGRHRGFWWSPDGTRIAFAEVNESGVDVRWRGDPARPGAGGEVVRYPPAGGTNARVRLGILPARGGRPVFARWDAGAFPYLARVIWDRGGPLAILVQDRLQTRQRLLAVDPATGATRLLVEESDPAWLNLDEDLPRFLPDGRFLWLTERSGAPEVELRAPDGARLASAVPPEAGYVAFAGAAADGTVLFTAAPDPTRTVLRRSGPGLPVEEVFAGAPAPATVSAVASEDGRLAVVTWKDLRRLPRSAVVSAAGTKLADLPSVAEEPAFSPTTELRQVGQGEDAVWAAVQRPRSQGGIERLPVLLWVYGGPAAAAGGEAAQEPRLLQQWLADQGFLVVSFDVRGTPRRGRAWERAIHRDLNRILGDQVAALRALAAEDPRVDLARAGIAGWSFGGWLAGLAAIERPDAFRAAVAGAPVTDWRLYDTHYTERHLGLPSVNPAGYDRASLVGRAAELAVPLLVVHGTADDNVGLENALQLAGAALRAGRTVDLVLVDGAKHGVREPLAYARTWERVAAFLSARLGAERPGPSPSRLPPPGGASAP
jgi:dipeptidyl-peptidase-4